MKYFMLLTLILTITGVKTLTAQSNGEDGENNDPAKVSGKTPAVTSEENTESGYSDPQDATVNDPAEPFETIYDESSDHPLIEEKKKIGSNKLFLHGFRVGIVYTIDGRKEYSDANIKSDFISIFGYELTQRIILDPKLNLIFVENILFGGLEQSKFLPSLNISVGFEILEMLQIAVGINMIPSNKWTHMIFAVGYTPRTGSGYIPIHFTFIPDYEGRHRFGLTIGASW